MWQDFPYSLKGLHRLGLSSLIYVLVLNLIMRYIFLIFIWKHEHKLHILCSSYYGSHLCIVWLCHNHKIVHSIARYHSLPTFLIWRMWLHSHSINSIKCLCPPIHRSCLISQSICLHQHQTWCGHAGYRWKKIRHAFTWLLNYFLQTWKT